MQYPNVLADYKPQGWTFPCTFVSVLDRCNIGNLHVHFVTCGLSCIFSFRYDRRRGQCCVLSCRDDFVQKKLMFPSTTRAIHRILRPSGGPRSCQMAKGFHQIITNLSGGQRKKLKVPSKDLSLQGCKRQRISFALSWNFK